MPISPYQIAAPLIALLAVVYAWNLFLRKKKTLWEVVLWTLFWGAIGSIALFPWMLSYLALLTGIKNQENAFLFTSIGILFFVIFYLIIRLEEVAHQQTRIIRSMALREAKLEDKPAAEAPPV